MGIKNFIKNNKDKVLHFIVGAVISMLVISMIYLIYPEKIILASFMGFLVSIIAGVLKETAIDDIVDNYDIIATMAGGLTASIIGCTILII